MPTKGLKAWNKGLTKKTDERMNYYSSGQFKKGQHSSPKTEFKKGRNAPKGKDNPCWKGGRTTHMGYIIVSTPNNRYENGSMKRIFEHRLIMEQKLNRQLLPNEIVHHRNGIRTDNRPENLEIVLKKSHFGQVRCPHCLKEFLIK